MSPLRKSQIKRELCQIMQSGVTRKHWTLERMGRITNKKASKKQYLPPPTKPAILSNDAWNEIAGSLGLTRRELQVVCGIFDDRTELAIAADLGISVHTVHTHIE